MVDDRPLVSIGLPVYNGAQFLRKTLDSLLGQTYENLELIVSDNASTDGTGEICQEYAGRDYRIHYYRNAANLGAAVNTNRVFALSSGDYFMWASDEDYWSPDYVRSCMEVLVDTDKIILAGSWGTFVEAETEEIILVDKGFSTVGLRPSERFKIHKQAIHSGSYVAVMFHGIYKRGHLSAVMPMWNLILSDQFLLARLCFLGEFHVVPKLLMMKRRRKRSMSCDEWHEEIGITSSVLTNYPYAVRDILYQKIIFQADNLSLREKIGLSCWSFFKYNHMYRDLGRLAKHLALRVWKIMKSFTWINSGK